MKTSTVSCFSQFSNSMEARVKAILLLVDESDEINRENPHLSKLTLKEIILLCKQSPTASQALTELYDTAMTAEVHILLCLFRDEDHMSTLLYNLCKGFSEKFNNPSRDFYEMAGADSMLFAAIIKALYYTVTESVEVTSADELRKLLLNAKDFESLKWFADEFDARHLQPVNIPFLSI